MHTTNTRNFRLELKTHLDHALKEPIRIHRRSDEVFIVINEDQLFAMQTRYNDLQQRLMESMDEISRLKEQIAN